MHRRDHSYIPTYYLHENDGLEGIEEGEESEEVVDTYQRYPYYPTLPSEKSRSGSIRLGGGRGIRRGWKYFCKKIFGALLMFSVVLFTVFCFIAILADPDNFMCAPIPSPQEYGAAPANFDIVGRIWVSPHDINTLPILDCYLQKNLVSSGGWLKRFEFIVSGEANSTVVSYVRDQLVPSSPGYTYLDVDNANEESVYKNLIDNTMYLKIDGDIVFIQQGAITKLLQANIENGIFQWEVRMLSANVAGMSSMDVRNKATGALWPYLPTSADSSNNLTSWRIDNTPAEIQDPQRDANGQWNWDNPQSLERTSSGAPRSWGKVNIPQTDLDETPLLGIQDDDPFGNCSFISPLCMIQQHYSFLFNLQNSIDQDVAPYILPPLSQTYTYCDLFLYSPQDLVPLHVVTFWPSTVLREQIQKQYLFSQSTQPNTTDAATVHKQGIARIGVVMNTMAMKYGYPGQLEGLDNTDLLERYSLLAKDMCSIETYAL